MMKTYIDNWAPYSKNTSCAIHVEYEKKKTNADRIRAMSDEELAECLDSICLEMWKMIGKNHRKMWLEWLKKEEGE